MKLLTVLFLLLAASASAQNVVNPKGVEFVPSPDHSATKLDLATGQQVPVVTKYELNAVAMTALGALSLTIDLGKPVPGATGCVTTPVVPPATTPVCIVVMLNQFATGLTPNVLYTATINTIGPDGSEVSAPSNSFGNAVVQVPRKALAVKVR